ncbi:MAG TPA: glycoside hydrolase family 38 C-terminal domain-containing protein [Candidatus Nitrosopolaris sp.]|nr:glycoside hydrolase family 38 C-terminal domain-containing protein [Candidatus Nitrosopolaris sp.]
MTGSTIYLVPHTHYDAVWVFNKNDYYYINIELILKQAVDLIKNTNYKFLIEQTFLLEEVERNHQQLFLDIQTLVKEGKIEMGGGQYLLCDVMLPHGEVLIREIEEGKKYVKEKFGRDVVVSWGADEFGFNAQWPQILRGCGYKYFAFRRGVDKPKPSEFWWQGIDSSRVLCHWMPLGYRAGLDLTKLEESYKQLKKYAASNKILMPSGSGVTLPQPETSDMITRWNRQGNKYDAKITMATALEFFEALEKENIEFKVRRGEMYSGRVSEVFPDCTSSRMWIKQRTKEYENLLLVLERWSAISYLEMATNNGDNSTTNSSCLSTSQPMSSSSSAPASYPNSMEEYWKNLLFIAMHDALPGTGIDEVYNEIKETFDKLETGLKRSISDCLGNFVKAIVDNNNDKSDFIIFNSLPWIVKDWTEVTLKFQKGKRVKKISNIKSLSSTISSPRSSKIASAAQTLEEGTKNILRDFDVTPIEILDQSFHDDGSIKSIRIGFITTVPALGFKTFEIIEAEKAIIGNSPHGNNESHLTHTTTFSNNEFEIKVDPDNAIVSVSKGNKLYFRGNELLLEEELGDLYYHRANLGLLKSETGEGVKYGSFKADNIKINKGNLRSYITLKSKYYALRWPYRLNDKLKPLLYRHDYIDIKKEIIIYNQLSRIDFVTHIYDKHPHSRIRVKFDTSVSGANNYWSGTQFGAVKRKTNLFYAPKNAKNWNEQPSGIFPSLEWIDYSDDSHGVSILHTGIPSHEIRDGSIYLTLLRSVMVLSSDGIMGPCIPTPDAAEMRPYSFKYSVLAHDSSWREARSYRRAMEVNMPLISVQVVNTNFNDNKYNYNTQLKDRNSANSTAASTYHQNANNQLGCFSFLELEPENILLSNLKMSSDSKSPTPAILVRIYETEGRKRTVAKLRFSKTIKSASFTDLLGQETKKVKRISNNNKYKNNNKKEILVEMSAFKIVTLKIEF